MKRQHLHILLIATWFCGCAVPLPDLDLKRTVKRDEIIGVWVLTPHSKDMIAKQKSAGTKPEKCHIKFSPDGTCEFHSAYSKGIDVVYLQSSGKWVLEHDTDGDSNVKKKNALRLLMQSSEFYSNTYLNCMEENGKLILWNFHGDPDSMDLIEYVKEES